jgi:hypothetical protein
MGCRLDLKKICFLIAICAVMTDFFFLLIQFLTGIKKWGAEKHP